jgi:uncharacterized protein YggE
VPAHRLAKPDAGGAQHRFGSPPHACGQLQGLGLTIGNLGWQVPQDVLDAAGRKARLEALSQLRQEASDAANTLGLTVAGYQDIDLTGGNNPPTPLFARPRPMMMAAMAAPIAKPDAQTVTETVAADVLLRVTPAPLPNH